MSIEIFCISSNKKFLEDSDLNGSKLKIKPSKDVPISKCEVEEPIPIEKRGRGRPKKVKGLWSNFQ